MKSWKVSCLKVQRLPCVGFGRLAPWVGLLCAVVLTGSAHAQISGSNGSFGAIAVAPGDTLTINLPPDGIIQATTVDVGAGATLDFGRNTLNTPVHLLATGDIVIAGTVSVSGEPSTPNGGGAGGPGGFEGGAAGRNGQSPGAGFGPGAGLGGLASSAGTTQNARAGLAAYGGLPNAPSTNNGAVYGSPLLVPLLGGSGGGGAGPTSTIRGGGGGGGAILLASDTRVEVTGAVTALGGQSQITNGHGSGGGIRIVAPVVSGSGTLNAAGGAHSQIAGHGRIRVDTIDLAGINFNMTPSGAVSLGSLLVGIPPRLPRLDILEVAGETVSEGTTSAVDILLPFNTTNDQTMTIQARNFTGIVPIRVVVTPQSGDPIVSDHEIDMSGGDPAQIVVDLDLPANVRANISVFTR